MILFEKTLSNWLDGLLPERTQNIELFTKKWEKYFNGWVASLNPREKEQAFEQAKDYLFEIIQITNSRLKERAIEEEAIMIFKINKKFFDREDLIGKLIEPRAEPISLLGYFLTR